RARNADALLLPAGKLVDPAQRLLAKPDTIEAGQRHFDFRARQPEQITQRRVKSEPPDQDVVERAIALDQLMVWKMTAVRRRCCRSTMARQSMAGGTKPNVPPGSSPRRETQNASAIGVGAWRNRSAACIARTRSRTMLRAWDSSRQSLPASCFCSRLASICN